MAQAPIIYWFRRDLRTADLPGLAAAARDGSPVVPCFIFDPDPAGGRAPGAASRWWLHHSLRSLADELETLGSPLVLRKGCSGEELDALVVETGASAVYCSRDLHPAQAHLEQELHRELARRDVELKRFPGSVLLQPERVATGQGDPYRVFTPFWRRCRELIEDEPPQPPPERLVAPERSPAAVDLEQLALLPRNPDWASHWPELWQPGTDGARKRLQDFLEDAVGQYRKRRDIPAAEGTSRLSPHLSFGELSPRQVWWQARQTQSEQPGWHGQIDKFLAELGWREFSYHLLHHFPRLLEEPFREQFERFPWREDREALKRWQMGRTGYPIVDAGMRELWHTGYMHNRVRMIVASFLCKHLLLPWQEGEAWFFDTLVDADPANNACGWQWTAGSGADAAPYFRIFNPTLQGEKFDADGAYVRRWVPELRSVPDKWIHRPSEAPDEVRREIAEYPEPMVDHKAARERALQAWDKVKGLD